MMVEQIGASGTSGDNGDLSQSEPQTTVVVWPISIRIQSREHDQSCALVDIVTPHHKNLSILN